MCGFVLPVELQNELAKSVDIKKKSKLTIQQRLDKLKVQKSLIHNILGEVRAKMRKKYQVFISSTYEDLKNERVAVTHCLLDIDCIPVGMEQFPASEMTQMEYIKKMLDECDCYILILAGKYGSPCEDGISYTEKEYDYAASIGLPVLSFVHRDIGNLPSKKCEETDERRQKLMDFRKKVCADRLVKFYMTVEDLRTEVVTSINKCIKEIPMRGWIRASADPREELLTQSEAMRLVDKVLESRIATDAEVKQMIEDIFREKPSFSFGTEFPENPKPGDVFFKLE